LLLSHTMTFVLAARQPHQSTRVSRVATIATARQKRERDTTPRAGQPAPHQAKMVVEMSVNPIDK
jgi:hypothetical protein